MAWSGNGPVKPIASMSDEEFDAFYESLQNDAAGLDEALARLPQGVLDAMNDRLRAERAANAKEAEYESEWGAGLIEYGKGLADFATDLIPGIGQATRGTKTMRTANRWLRRTNFTKGARLIAK